MNYEWEAFEEEKTSEDYDSFRRATDMLISRAFSVPVSFFKTPVNDVNLPRYRCRCDERIKYFCPICMGRGWLTYSEALKSYGLDSLPLGLQIPQCHICSKFKTDDNPLFAYSHLEGNGFKFIYRCLKGHDHDHGMTLTDLQTGLEVHL